MSSPNRAQLFLRNTYTVFTKGGTVALRSVNKNFSGELQFCSYFPFGMSIAPIVFTKLLKIPISLLRSLGIHLIIYLHDILIINHSKEKLIDDYKRTENLLENLSFEINYEKSVLEFTVNLARNDVIDLRKLFIIKMR